MKQYIVTLDSDDEQEPTAEELYFMLLDTELASKFSLRVRDSDPSALPTSVELEEEMEVVAQVTSEGIIIDWFDSEGLVRASFGRTFDEILPLAIMLDPGIPEDLFDRNEDKE